MRMFSAVVYRTFSFTTFSVAIKLVLLPDPTTTVEAVTLPIGILLMLAAAGLFWEMAEIYQQASSNLEAPHHEEGTRRK